MTAQRDALISHLHGNGEPIRTLAEAADISTGKTHQIVKAGPPTVCSVGYEGKDLDSFLQRLVDNSVGAVHDVRLTPISRKKGFSKTRLHDALAEAGIEYRHHRALGNPKDNRDAFRAGHELAHTRYADAISTDEAADALAQIALAATTDRRPALLCFERDHSTCHRALVVDRLRDALPVLDVRHL